MSARSVAVKVLSEIERKGSYSNIAADFAINQSGLERKDAAFMSMLVYGVLQRKITLDFVIAKNSQKGLSKIHPLVLNTLRVGIYQLLFMDRVPESAAVNESVKIIKKSKQSFAAGFVNAILRKVAGSKKQIFNEIDINDISVKYSCPNEICVELLKWYSANDVEAFLKASVEVPETYARVNTLKIAPHELFERLFEKDIVCTEKEPEGAFTLLNAGNIENLPEFSEGLFYIQDNASQIAISAIGIHEGDKVLDVCSAPGGKSFTAAMFLNGTGSVTSCDIYEKRVGLIAIGAKRLSIKNLNAVTNDALKFNPDFGHFDVVISDVPCSGLGVIRRKPEIKYRALSEYEDLTDIQLGILKTSAEYVRVGGKLMYSTCTIRKSENEFIIKKFLENNIDFKIIKEETLMPHTHGSDGFYYCLMERENG